METKDKLRELEKLFNALENAHSYEEWIRTSKAIDAADNRAAWRENNASSLYDSVKVTHLLKELRTAREDNDLAKLLYLVRTVFTRNFANVGDPRLFKYAWSGTKILINEFISECELALQTLATKSDDSQATDVLNTLVQTRKAYGRTALVFSGGSILGFMHAGVIRELVDRNLLPKIISGSSAGSIFAALVCIHREEEFDRMWDLMSIPMSIFGPIGQEESFATHLKRVLTVGTWIDSTYLREMMQGLIGDVTFQEAYNRTGRILNVTVSVAGSHDLPRLLNYLTAPNVVIWSAVVCSCSVPFVFAADSIFAKNPHTKEIYPWSKRAFIDGSVDNDMPLARLSEMFNVNHFIACQVNPHIAPLFTSDRPSLNVKEKEGLPAAVTKNSQSRSSWLSAQLAKGMQAGRSLLRNEIEHGLTILKTAGIAPSAANTMLNVIGQEYWGDITIVPQINWRDVTQLFKNPSYDQIKQLFQRGRQATWPKLALIRNHCAIELALDKAIVDLRARVISTVFTPAITTISSSPPPSPRVSQTHKRHHSSVTRTKAYWGSSSKYHRSGRSRSMTNLTSLKRSPLLRPNYSRTFSHALIYPASYPITYSVNHSTNNSIGQTGQGKNDVGSGRRNSVMDISYEKK